MTVTVDSRAQELVDGLLAQPWGQVSPSVYETGRVVALTPWLAGHEQRLAYLRRTQRPDGAWGAPQAGYTLVPTLSAVDALLDDGTPESAAAAARGLSHLRSLLLDLPPLPDMPALELISTSLIRSVNRRAPGALPVPEGLDDGTLDLVTGAFLTGAPVPHKLLHALEILGPDAAGLKSVSREATGTVGAAPAATAAWLGSVPPPPDDPSRRFLEAAAAQHGGPVACGLPVTVFERGWALTTLARAGLSFDVPAELVLGLSGAIGPHGAAAAAGLPADADTTAGALYALALLGAPVSPDALLLYEGDTHFHTWPGEQGRSVSTNAHVLEAFGQYGRVGSDPRHRAAAAKTVRWLCAQQRPDGSWEDRWHASPYYATMCAALALAEFGGPAAAGSVRRALSWVRTTVRRDGSWGLWGGTAEETAYALHVLLLADGPRERDELVLRGAGHLLEPDGDHPPLWHDKDLYTPTAIVQSAVLAAAHIAQSQLGGTLVT